jgi:hypothetical protein
MDAQTAVVREESMPVFTDEDWADLSNAPAQALRSGS